MKFLLTTAVLLTAMTSIANACPNLTGVYAASSDPLNQQVWSQKGCSTVSVGERIANDPYLGTVDLTPVVMTVGRHVSPAPMKVVDSYYFTADAFVVDHIGYEIENGAACTDRHEYSLDRRRNLVVSEHYFCPNGEIAGLDVTSTIERVGK